MKRRLLAIILVILFPSLLFSQLNQKNALPTEFMLANYTVLMGAPVIGFAIKDNSKKLDVIQSDLKPFSFNAIKGRIGESLTDSSYFNRLGENWVRLTPRNGIPQGLDHAYIKFSNKGPSNLLIADSKFTKQSFISSLGYTKDGQQLSLSWIKPRVESSILSDYSVIRELDATGDVFFRQYGATSVAGSIRPIQKESFYWHDVVTDKWYYSGPDLDRTARIKKIDAVDQFLNGCIDGKINFNRRGIQYRIVNNQLIELVFNVGDSSQLIETRIISNTTEVTSLLHSSENWSPIIKKYGVSNVEPKYFSNEEIMELFTLNISKPDSVKNSLVVKKLNSISSRNAVLKNYGKSTIALAGLMVALDIINQGADRGFENIDPKQLLIKGEQGAAVGISVSVSNQLAKKLTKRIPFEDLASKFLKAGVKQTTKKSLVTVAKNLIPAGFDFGLGTGIDYLMISSDFKKNLISNEVRTRMIKRSLFINGFSSSFGIGIGVVTEALPIPGSGIVIGTAASMISEIGLEFLIPVPDEIDPKIIRQKLENNPTQIDEWMAAYYQ
jgi:hypothetical protein